MGCFSAGAAIGGVIGAAGTAGNAGVAAGASLAAIELSTQVSRSLHDHWKAYYASCDAATIAEVCAIPIYVAPSATIAGRQRLEVIRTIGRKRQQLYRGQNVFHVGKMAQDCNILSALEGTAALDASEWGYRRGQNLEIQRNQQRLENIYAYLGLGRNLLSNALGAAAIAGSIASQLGAEAGTKIAGWSQFLGFLNTKEGKQFAGDVFGGITRSIFGEKVGPSEDYKYEDIGAGAPANAQVSTSTPDQTLAGGTDPLPNPAAGSTYQPEGTQ